MNVLCDRLENYLDDELDATARTEFEKHLEQCEICRLEVAFAHQLYGELAEARASAPPELVERVVRQMQRRAWTRPRRLAAAACLAVAVGIWARSGRWENVHDAPLVSSAPADSAPHSASYPALHLALHSAAPARVTSADPNLIVAPLKSQNPRVTIVWVYPTVSLTQKTDSPGGSGLSDEAPF